MPETAQQAEPECTPIRPIDVTIEPAWAEWESALAEHNPDPARRQLGIPNDRPVVFSGHQPVVFHPGILAKLIAQHEAARRTGAARVWIVADQDPVDLETVRVPVGRGEHLTSQTIQLLEAGSTPPGVPSASLPTMHIKDTDDDRLEALVSHLRDCAHEPSLARQFASATIRLACDRLGIEMPQLIYASDLFRSDQMFSIAQRTIDDPESCARAYNTAVRAHPGARVRPLTIEDDRIELPLWGLRENRPRVPVDTDNIDDFGQGSLIPRGLLMSLLVRAHLGELFIHGTGGWAYDRVTHDWAKAWLGIELAPMALTTATQHLELGFSDDEAIDLDHAAWRLHHARHTPGMLGDHDRQAHKDELVEQIRVAKAEGSDPSKAFGELQRLLDAYRADHAQGLERLGEQVRRAQRMRDQIELANDRTWPFVLFSEEQLGELKRAVVDAMH